MVFIFSVFPKNMLESNGVVSSTLFIFMEITQLHDAWPPKVLPKSKMVDYAGSSAGHSSLLR